MASAGCTVAQRAQARGASTQAVAGRKQAGAAARVAAPQPSVRSHIPSRRLPVLAAALAEEPVEVVDAEFDMKSLYDDFTELLDQYDHNFKRGDMITGTVFRADEKGAYIDIGAKTAGYCSSAECSLSPDVKVRGSLLSPLTCPIHRTHTTPVSPTVTSPLPSPLHLHAPHFSSSVSDIYIHTYMSLRLPLTPVPRLFPGPRLPDDRHPA